MGFGGVKRWGLILLLLVQCFVWPTFADEPAQASGDEIEIDLVSLTEEKIKEYYEKGAYVFRDKRIKFTEIEDSALPIIIDLRLVFENCTFEDSVYFDVVVFEYPVSFLNSVFKRTVEFNGCTFKSHVNFSNCLFKGRVSFGKHPAEERTNFEDGKQEKERKASKFLGHVLFSRANFEAGADFPLVVFENEANFKESTFKGRADFNKAIFKSKVEFDRATFHGEADFERSIFLAGTSGGGVNFYKADFQGDLSFSKAVFQSGTSFKKARFRGRLFLSNCLFLRKADFERASFDGEVYAAGLNEPSEHFTELLVHQIGEICELPEKPEDDGIVHINVDAWKAYVHDKARDKEFSEELTDWDCSVPSMSQRPWAGLVSYPSPETFEALQKALTSSADSSIILSGARFRKAVDFRGAIIREADLSSNEMITVFQGPVEMADVTIIGLFDLHDAVFQGPVDLSGVSFIRENSNDEQHQNPTRVDLRGAEFQAKLRLPLETLFPDSGLVSQQLVFLNAFSKPPEFISLPRASDQEDQGVFWSIVESCHRLWSSILGKPAEDQDLHRYPDADSFNDTDKGQIIDLYQQLERLFRKNVQLTEANEMAVRAAWLNLNLGKERLSSLVTLIAVPIKNVLFLMVAVNLLFYLCMLKRKAIHGRKEERTFKPSKIPFVYMPDIDHTEQGAIVPCNTLWRRLVWPLFLCLGTFFALFSLGSEYVTRDERCLDNMKTLRVAGFVLIPLLIYALAKRSEGLHHIFTLMG